MPECANLSAATFEETHQGEEGAMRREFRRMATLAGTGTTLSRTRRKVLLAIATVPERKGTTG
ncbi:MAG: hypothetical protein LBR92_02420 [Puniceicoccales bacterium]|nr:hypothetical protein [Puniceicoccales bacterium]